MPNCTHYANRPTQRFLGFNNARKSTSSTVYVKTRSPLAPCAALVRVEFLVPEYFVEFGQSLTIVGNDAAIGTWDAPSGAALEWAEGNNWKGTVDIESDTQLEFKLVKATGDEFIWEEGENKTLTVPAVSCRVVCPWGESIQVELKDTAEQEKKLRSAAGAAEEKAARVKSKSKAIADKVSGLEEKVSKSSSKMKSIQQVQTQGEDRPVVAEVVAAAKTEEKAPEPSAPAVEADPAPAVADNNGANGGEPVAVPAEMAAAVSAAAVGSDGSLVINFNDNSIDAASLAAKLLK